MIIPEVPKRLLWMPPPAGFGTLVVSPVPVAPIESSWLGEIELTLRTISRSEL
jgi:hypothetical protein